MPQQSIQYLKIPLERSTFLIASPNLHTESSLSWLYLCSSKETQRTYFYCKTVLHCVLGVRACESQMATSGSPFTNWGIQDTHFKCNYILKQAMLKVRAFHRLWILDAIFSLKKYRCSKLSPVCFPQISRNINQ